MNSSGSGTRRPVGFAVSTIILGVIGWFASFELLTEYISTLVNPSHVPNCNINPLVTCGPNMESWQGSIFGFSNTIIGVSAFAAPIAVGVALLAGARFAPWFWRLYQLGLLGGFILICWLAYQSIFGLGTMCPWCMVVWTVTTPLFWWTLARPAAVGDIPVGPRRERLSRTMLSWTWVLVLLTYIIIAALAQFQLSWIPRAFL